MFRGAAQANNTALAFNQGDTLQLTCKAQSSTGGTGFAFAVTKGSKPPSNVTVDTSGSRPTYTLIDPGTVIYNDVDDVLPGFENFVIIRFFSTGTSMFGNEYLRLGVGMLRKEDAGTYHCSTVIEGTITTSGGLTINVFTKSGQAHSSQTNANKLMTYSAIMLGASKLLF